MKDDEFIRRIKTFDAANGGGVGWYEDKGAYHLYLLETEAPIARLKPVGTRRGLTGAPRSDRCSCDLGIASHGVTSPRGVCLRATTGEANPAGAVRAWRYGPCAPCPARHG